MPNFSQTGNPSAYSLVEVCQSLSILVVQLTDTVTSSPIMQVAGERYVYKFVCEPEALISLAFPDNQRPSLKAEFERYVNEEDTVPLSHLDEGGPYSAEQGPQNMGPQTYSKGYMY